MIDVLVRCSLKSKSHAILYHSKTRKVLNLCISGTKKQLNYKHSVYNMYNQHKIALSTILVPISFCVLLCDDPVPKKHVSTNATNFF